ncbi:MAG TPA: ATP-binding cassette domain-containing protein [Bryobacteraceae bacterium]|jgi:phospholipid/cholesterol/gamma-HCH transport system ATP-binding protein|nr:ATP-binding cassette domain-containing protein [Bryobacteraceae bacterium]
MPETQGESTVLEFRDISLRFGGEIALDHVSFAMSAGDSRIVFGVAGSGKTTLLKVALGLVKPDSGRVYVFGQDATDLKETAWFHLRARMGILFQEGGLFDSMNIAENVAYPLINQPALRERIGQNGAVDERVREALRFVELEHTLDKFPSELSGGMRRRVGIARAIVTEPPLLLYDSPTAGLDPITANTIINLIIKERDLRDAASILVTHRFQDGHLMADFRYNPDNGQIEKMPLKEDNQVKTKFFVMNGGRLVFVGTRAELRASTDPYVMKFAK